MPLAMETVNLGVSSVRELNGRLHEAAHGSPARWRVLNPGGFHAIATGLAGPLGVDIDGHVGHYCAGMNKQAHVRVYGNAGMGVAENLMSGSVVVDRDASQAAGAAGRGGLLVIRGKAAARCAIAMNGVDIVVGGSVGHASASMARRGRLVVCGDTGDALGDSIHGGHIYVAGRVAGLGWGCVEKPIEEKHIVELRELLRAAAVDADPADFRRYGSARELDRFVAGNAELRQRAA